MINTWGKEEITKLNYEFRQDGIYSLQIFFLYVEYFLKYPY